MLALAGVSNKHGSFPSCSPYEALACLGSARGHVQEQRKPPECRVRGRSVNDLVATFLRAQPLRCRAQEGVLHDGPTTHLNQHIDCPDSAANQYVAIKHPCMRAYRIASRYRSRHFPHGITQRIGRHAARYVLGFKGCDNFIRAGSMRVQALRVLSSVCHAETDLAPGRDQGS